MPYEMNRGKKHTYHTKITWTGNTGKGTAHYAGYERNYTVSIHDKADIRGSSDLAFRGNPSLPNPEELFLASVSSCHMLWYLHLCADAGIIVHTYEDSAVGTMSENGPEGGRFIDICLHPVITIGQAEQTDEAAFLHEKANALCFIANSLNFKVRHEPVIRIA